MDRDDDREQLRRDLAAVQAAGVSLASVARGISTADDHVARASLSAFVTSGRALGPERRQRLRDYLSGVLGGAMVRPDSAADELEQIGGSRLAESCLTRWCTMVCAAGLWR